MKSSLPLVALFVTSLCGCSDSARCVETSRTEVADPAASLLIGGTYEDVLTTIVGERSGPLTWLPSDEHVSGFPSPGETSITVTIAEPTEAWDVGLERQGGGRNERLSCPSVVELELEVELRSDDGALDMSVTVPATLRRPDAANILVDVTDEELGTIDWRPVDEDASLLLSLSYGGVSGAEGALRLRTESSDDADGAGMTVDLAAWSLP